MSLRTWPFIKGHLARYISGPTFVTITSHINSFIHYSIYYIFPYSINVFVFKVLWILLRSMNFVRYTLQLIGVIWKMMEQRGEDFMTKCYGQKDQLWWASHPERIYIWRVSNHGCMIYQFGLYFSTHLVCLLLFLDFFFILLLVA